MKTNRERAVKIAMTYHDIPQLMEWIEIALDKAFERGRRKERRTCSSCPSMLAEKRMREEMPVLRGENMRMRKAILEREPPFDADKAYGFIEAIVHHRFMAGYSLGHNNQIKYREHYNNADIAIGSLIQELGIEDDSA